MKILGLYRSDMETVITVSVLSLLIFKHAFERQSLFTLFVFCD